MKDRLGIIHGFLKGGGHSGQHFLLDDKVLNQLIIEVSQFSPKIVIEVGSGFGDITEGLLKISRMTISVEKNERLYIFLKKRFENNKNIRLIHNDILNVKFPREAIVVGTPPYLISTKLIHKILVSKVKGSVLILQKDFVERINPTYKPKSSYLAPLIDFLGEIKILCDVNRDSFYPQPNVNSTLFKIILNKDPDIECSEIETFADFLYNLYKTSRMKMVKQIIQNNYTDAAKFNLNSLKNHRIYELGPEDLLNLYMVLHKKGVEHFGRR